MAMLETRDLNAWYGASHTLHGVSIAVEQGEVSSMVTLNGTLTYRARSDGSPYSAINHASGTYTTLPEAGDKVDCGDVLYRVDEIGRASCRERVFSSV